MNKFSVLDDSDNEEEVKNQKKVNNTKDAKAAPAAANAKPAAGKAATESKDSKPKTNNTQAANKDSKPKDNKNGAKDAKPASAPAVDGEQSGKQRRDNNHQGDRRRGGRGSNNTNNENTPEGEQVGRFKREFERRSGTGRGREVSKGGRGKFGAGNPEQDALDAEKEGVEAVEGAEKPEGEEEAAEPVVEAEPEPATFTLDEFLAKRNEAREKVAAIGSKAERTVDQAKQFAGLTAKQDDTSEFIAGKGAKAVASKKDQRCDDKQAITDLGFKFEQVNTNDREGGRFGGRGGGRGGDRNGGRGNGRGRGRDNNNGGDRRPRSNGNKVPLNVFNNLTEFPSL